MVCRQLDTCMWEVIRSWFTPFYIHTQKGYIYIIVEVNTVHISLAIDHTYILCSGIFYTFAPLPFSLYIYICIYTSFTPLHYPSHHSNHSSLSSIWFPSTTYSLLHLFPSFPAGTTLWPSAGSRTQRTGLPSSNWQTSWSLIMSAWSVPVCALMTICQTLKKRENSSKETPTDIGCEGLLWNQWVPLISSMNQPCWDST